LRSAYFSRSFDEISARPSAIAPSKLAVRA
jgi:hypothetical protein